MEAPWAADAESVCTHWGVNPETGLTDAQVQDHRRTWGRNRLQEIRPVSAWTVLWNQIRSLIVFLLMGAAAVAFAFHETLEGFAIAAVIVINTLIGFFTEIRAVRSMEALKKLGGLSTKVRRNGHVQEIPSEDLLPGDIVILEGGDLVSADMRLITASKLQADESSLTGESFPVNKNESPAGRDLPLAERHNMIYKGTALTRGSGEAVITGTGMHTELGKISDMIRQADEESTPLEKRLEKLGRSLVWITFAIAIVVAVSGIAAGKAVFLMIETAIALAVAAIPEGLPIVATIALARGMFRMARQNALVRRLSAVETLGATTVIFTDKTGTLTENRMTVSTLILAAVNIELRPDGFFSGDTPMKSLPPDLRMALEICILCNNASLPGPAVSQKARAVGDPLEIALLEAVRIANLDIDRFRTGHPEEAEDAFDSDSKRMATFNRFDGNFRVSIKGALESVLGECSHVWTADGLKILDSEQKKHWTGINESLGKKGLRVLALAVKEEDSAEAHPYQNAALVGLLGLLDPPRQDVREAIDACHTAGIRVIMVTGDQPVTAGNIGEAVGIIREGSGRVMHSSALKSMESMTDSDKAEALGIPVFARVSPAQKLDLIALHQENGEIVAMTGDGVNDAPALKKADIGVAMGLRGTQVAQEAADMVLRDDAFSTIVRAVRQGRIIFGNIRKAVQYLLSCNVSEVLAVGLASMVNAPLPILPLQILFLNLVTDVFPALALSMGEGEPQIMNRPPRSPRDPILGRRQWTDVFVFGLLMTVSVLGALALAIGVFGMETRRAVSVSFLTMGFTQLWHVFNMRERGSRFFRNEISGNPFVWGALVLCIGLLLAAVYIPGLAAVLKVSDPGMQGWLLVLGASLFPWITGQLVRTFGR
ncbi:cation-translocating P-type ATPase [bacterium]|nr:cation-translocating P-type ATPase [bacterium]